MPPRVRLSTVTYDAESNALSVTRVNIQSDVVLNDWENCKSYTGFYVPNRFDQASRLVASRDWKTRGGFSHFRALGVPFTRLLRAIFA